MTERSLFPAGIPPSRSARAEYAKTKNVAAPPRGSKMTEQIIEATTEMKDMKVKLSTVWIFAMFNYLYADVLTLTLALAHPEALKKGYVGGVPVTQEFMLGAAILMEIPIAMVLLSRILKYKANCWANIIAAVILTVAHTLSFFVGGTPRIISFYTFFSTIEIVCTLLIVWYAWKRPNLEDVLVMKSNN
jgi:hypothetical protein